VSSMPKPHVLVVDDSPTGRHAAVHLLEKHGYAVVAVEDGEQALAKVAEAPPRVILLDIVLPKLNGYQVLREVKAAAQTPIKVILVSSKNQESDRFWGMKQGADDYIAKPYPEAALVAAVARHFS
jgi:CheY-like chemotaxis protein